MATATTRFELRLSPDESTRLRKLAEIHGITAAEFLRRQINNTVLEQPRMEKKETPKEITVINAINKFGRLFKICHMDHNYAQGEKTLTALREFATEILNRSKMPHEEKKRALDSINRDITHFNW